MNSTFWAECSNEEKEELLVNIGEETGEYFEPQLTSALKARTSPFEGNNVYKLIFKKQWVKKFDGTQYTTPQYLVKEGSYSILVEVTNHDQIESKFIIPFLPSSADFHAINKFLNLNINKDNIIAYIKIWGEVVRAHNCAFNIIEDLSFPKELDENGLVNKLRSYIEHRFSIIDNEVKIPVEKKNYPFIGTAYKFRVPVVFSDDFYEAKFRISKYGWPDMEEDESTQIVGVEKLFPITEYHTITKNSEIANILSKHSREILSPVRKVSVLGFIERCLVVLCLPVFLFFILVILSNLSNFSEVRSFFDLISITSIFSYICLLCGFVFIVISTLRVLFLEVMGLISNKVPSVYSALYGKSIEIFHAMFDKLGALFAGFLFSFDFFFVPLVGAILFTYGFVNIFNSDAHNIIDVTWLVISNMPFLSYLNLGSFFSDDWIVNIDSGWFLPLFLKVYFTSVVLAYISRLIMIRISRKGAAE